ncbi:Uncharacterized protein APZ42_013682 [Daphnia magna]|uniref:tRNA-queuosine alpha-mannosyltransferase n=1 Tax=Daphnia magna TaxID=35525 RepID=A0A162QRE8_9CRUS|nr:Uncharacterized protein APZ42_013682 [Daphnia magna]
MARILFIEPFFAGSHKQLLDTLISGIDFEELGYELLTLPGKKWHWRARTSALYFAEVIPRKHVYEVLFASSVLNMAELIALRPDLMACRKVLYFHENQLIYPVRKQQERIEATILGCFPLCPWRLSYPEIFPEECLYRTENQLVKQLKYFCKNPSASRNLSVNLDRFKWMSLKSQYEEALLIKKADYQCSAH